MHIPHFVSRKKLNTIIKNLISAYFHTISRPHKCIGNTLFTATGAVISRAILNI